MPILFIYFLTAIGATILGAMVGLGGGVIIKPMLDLIGYHDLATIGMLSTFTVFSMAIVAILRRLKEGYKFNYSIVALFAVGSILGGNIGTTLFNQVLSLVATQDTLLAFQSLLLALLLSMVIVLPKLKIKVSPIKNKFGIVIVGFILGVIAAFLGIGGGPINVVILVIIFGMDNKEAAVYSIFIILFSQFSKIFSTAVTMGFSSYDLQALWVMIPAGIAGGLIGSKLNKLLDTFTIARVFNIVVFLLIILNLFNCALALGIV